MYFFTIYSTRFLYVCVSFISIELDFKSLCLFGIHEKVMEMIRDDFDPNEEDNAENI